ncbi:MAG TPA: O-antigen ligase family protein [Candidatus Saccharimonadales bacterium]|jgi:O-antigen ligase|nr:O-antigen ligase family protein [Candidatus Saccharimonadales bacterium]
MSQASVLVMRPAFRGYTLSGWDNDRRLRWVFLFLWLFTVAVYARPEDIFPFLGTLHLTFTCGLLAGVTYLLAWLSGRARPFWTKEMGVILLLTAWYIVGLPFALWRGGSFQVLVNVWLKTVLIFFLLTQTLLTMERIRALLWAIILSELVVTGFSIIEASSVAWVGGRMLGVSLGILGWNFLGIAAAMTIPYIAALFMLQRSFLKAGLLITASASMLWMLVLTASRGGLLSVVLSVGLTLLLVLRGSARGRLTGMAIVLALFAAIALAPKVLWQRLGTVWNASDIYADQVAASAAASQEDHIAVLDRSVRYTLEHPVFGLGLGNFQVASGIELHQPGAWVGTHNTFTEVSSEAGIPALVMLTALLAMAVRNMRIAGRTPASSFEGMELNLMARATLVSLLSFIFGGFFVHVAYEYYSFYPVAVAVAIRSLAQAHRSNAAMGIDVGPHQIVAEPI